MDVGEVDGKKTGLYFVLSAPRPFEAVEPAFVAVGPIDEVIGVVNGSAIRLIVADDAIAEVSFGNDGVEWAGIRYIDFSVVPLTGLPEADIVSPKEFGLRHPPDASGSTRASDSGARPSCACAKLYFVFKPASKDRRQLPYFVEQDEGPTDFSPEEHARMIGVFTDDNRADQMLDANQPDSFRIPAHPLRRVGPQAEPMSLPSLYFLVSENSNDEEPPSLIEVVQGAPLDEALPQGAHIIAIYADKAAAEERLSLEVNRCGQ